MARAQSRSCNAELAQGMAVDGKYKQVVTDRGGLVENGTWEHRKYLSTPLYGIVEADTKEAPDGVGPIRTLYTTDTPTPGVLISDQKL